MSAVNYTNSISAVKTVELAAETASALDADARRYTQRATSIRQELLQGQVQRRAAWAGSRFDLSLIAPDGTVIDATTIDPSIYHAKEATYEMYRIQSPQVGEWTAAVEAVYIPASGELVQLFADVPAAAEDTTPPNITKSRLHYTGQSTSTRARCSSLSMLTTRSRA